MSRPDHLAGTTHKIKAALPGGAEVKLYITVNFHEDKPYEVFANTNNQALYEHMAAVTLMASRLLQAGVDATTIAKDFKQIHSPVTGHMARGGYAASIYARIGRILEEVAGAQEQSKVAT